MKKNEAYEFVKEHFDDDEIDDSDLEEVFAAIYERPADDDDKEQGLWSAVASATPGLCGCSTRSEHYRTKINIDDEVVLATYVFHGDGYADNIRVDHETSDGCPDNILDKIAETFTFDGDLSELAEDVRERWAQGFDGDNPNISVTVKQCSRQATT